MFKMMIRSIAVLSILALVSPFAALAADGGGSASALTPEVIATAAPVSALQGNDELQAPTLVDLILGFFHSVVVGTSAPGAESASPGPSPQQRGPGIDPYGQQAN